MRSFRIINPLVKSRKAKAVCLVLGMLLAVLTSAYAVWQPVVDKYPTGYVLGTAAMGSGMTLEKGSVFGFNSAKSAATPAEILAGTEAYATIQEGACATPLTTFDFTEGREGFTNVTPVPAGLTYGYSGVEGNGAGGALQTRLNKKNTALTYAWKKSFLWDCGTPLGTVPVSIWYRRGATWVSASTTTLSVILTKPDLSTVAVIASTAITGAANSAWTQLSAANIATNFTTPGIYTLTATGSMLGTSTATSNMYLFLDDFNLGLTSNYASYSQDVEFTERATPSSAAGSYILDIKARKIAGDTETTNIQVCGDALPTCATWVTRYPVTSAYPAPTWYLFNSYTLTTAEYNGGNVRIRYVDATPTADYNRGGIDVEYQRITVNQGTCVDSVSDTEADCGKCHNYNGDVTKPWPSLGMHNLHAQSESISDCLWCHPNNGTNSAHSNGALTIAGTKLFRAADGNLNGAPATATFDNTTKQCSNIACHKGLITPSWEATYVSSGFSFPTLIARNCSRCHNSGTAGADNASNLNLNVAWPSTGDGGGHNSHNAAVAFDEYSCQTNGSCHPDNRSQHTVVGDGLVVVKMAPNYASPNAVSKYIKSSATSGDGICVNVSCHGGQGTPKFNLASTNPINLTATNGTACIMCHVGEQANGWGTAPGNATQYNSPISGLHRGSPPTSGQDHAGGMTNGCQACHTLASLTLHFKTAGGVTNLDSTAMDSMQGAAFTAAVGYTAGTGTSPNYTTVPTCVTAVGTTCHAENNTTTYRTTTPGNWKRKWSWDSYAADTPDSEKVKQCNGCHGHWGTFNVGVVEPHVISNSNGTLRTDLINSHSESGVNCGTMCHAQTNVAYNHGVVVGATTKDMTLNSNALPVDNGTTVGCSACHANEAAGVPDGVSSHVFADAAWTTASNLAGPTVTCYTCHGGGTANSGSGFNYWPDGAAYPDTAGGTAATSRHLLHVTKIAAKLAYNLTTITDVQQKAICRYCHGTLPGGAGGHQTDVVTVGAQQAEVTLIQRIWNATADATAPAFSFNPADGTCVGIDCHNNKTTTATYSWRSNGTSTCLMCHTIGLAGSDPNTGLHNITVAGPQHHDDGLSGGCTACHLSTPPATHINGTFTADGNNTVAERFVNSPGAFTYTELATPTLGRSGSCSGAGLAACHSDAGNWARLWSTEANSIATATSSQRCNVCHGQWSTITNSAGWATGTSHYKAGGTNASTNTRGKIHDVSTCENCHVYSTGAARHNTVTRSININNFTGVTPVRSSQVYGTGLAGCTGCHLNDAAHQFPIATYPVVYVAGATIPAPSCTGCHDAGSSGAPIVNSTTGTHIKTTVAGAFTACTTCHNNHSGSAVGGVIIPNNTTVGINYVTSGHTGVQLGGTGTDASISALTTEAAMCWACHALPANLISEWGANTDPSTGNSTFNYGAVTTPDWTAANWSSSRTEYAYKTAAIQSTHTANPTVTDAALGGAAYSRTETKNTAAQIRCSNCHDVHELGLATGDKKEGKPYLRGSWMGNPYEEDGAPRSVYANTTYFSTSADVFGQVPRGAITGNQKIGGYWIDQNNVTPMTATTAAQGTANVNPTSTWEPLDTNAEAGNATATSPAFAGLCMLCHTNAGATTALKIDALDQVASEGLWMGTNGHANSVKGGTGSGSASSFNVFTARGGTTVIADNNPRQHYVGQVTIANSNSGVGFRSANSSALRYTPALFAAATRPYGYNTDNWVVDESGATKENQYHKFSCSKCHNPHASRLPKLMITNCLDTVHNTWDNQFQMVTAVSTLNNNREMAQWTSAQNCHRYSESNNTTVASPEYKASRAASPAGSGAGWNSVTPWKSTSTTP